MDGHYFAETTALDNQLALVGMKTVMSAQMLIEIIHLVDSEQSHIGLEDPVPMMINFSRVIIFMMSRQPDIFSLLY